MSLMHLTSGFSEALCGAVDAKVTAGYLWYTRRPEEVVQEGSGAPWCQDCIERIPLAELADTELGDNGPKSYWISQCTVCDCFHLKNECPGKFTP